MRQVKIEQGLERSTPNGKVGKILGRVDEQARPYVCRYYAGVLLATYTLRLRMQVARDRTTLAYQATELSFLEARRRST